MGLLDYDSLACLLEASPNRYPLSSPPWSFCTIMFFFSGGDSTLSGRALGWLNRFLEHSLNGDYNDYKSVLLMSWFYLLEINSTWMRMCRLGCIFFDVMVFPSPLRMITTCELKTDEEELIFWGSVSYKALRSTPVGDQMGKRGIIKDHLINTDILRTLFRYQQRIEIKMRIWLSLWNNPHNKVSALFVSCTDLVCGFQDGQIALVSSPSLNQSNHSCFSDQKLSNKVHWQIIK